MKEIFASVKKSYCSVLHIGCIPTDVKGVYYNIIESRTFDGNLEIWTYLLMARAVYFTREILLPVEDNIRLSSPPCNIVYLH